MLNNVDHTIKPQAILSLCPGILGLERGVERGIRSLAADGYFSLRGDKAINTIAYVEIEAFIIANLVGQMEAGILDPAPIWSNVKTFDAQPFRNKLHGIVGGYPCQPFSHAGDRKGVDDERHLWPYIFEQIKTSRPHWVFFENVAGHLTLGYGEVRRNLSSAGYRVEEGIFTAEEVGAPHRRERLFIFGVMEDADIFGWGGRCVGGAAGNERKIETSGSSTSLGDTTRCNQQYDGTTESPAYIQNRGSGNNVANTNSDDPGTNDGGIPSEERAGNGEEDQRERVWREPGAFDTKMANAGDKGLQGNQREELFGEGWREERGTVAERSKVFAKKLAHTNSAGQQMFRNDGQPNEAGNPGTINSDTFAWPAGQGLYQHEWEEPRSIESILVDNVNGSKYKRDTVFISNYGTEKERAIKKLLDVWNEVNQEGLQWEIGGLWAFLQERILFAELLSHLTPQKLYIRIKQQNPGTQNGRAELRELRYIGQLASTSCGPEPTEQLAREFENALWIMSYQIALERGKIAPTTELYARMHSMWDIFKNTRWDVSEALSAVQEIWQPTFDEKENRKIFFCACREYVMENNRVAHTEDLHRAIGNSVVEQAAELAFVTLYKKHLNNHNDGK